MKYYNLNVKVTDTNANNVAYNKDFMICGFNKAGVEEIEESVVDFATKLKNADFYRLDIDNSEISFSEAKERDLTKSSDEIIRIIEEDLDNLVASDETPVVRMY